MQAMRTRGKCFRPVWLVLDNDQGSAGTASVSR